MYQILIGIIKSKFIAVLLGPAGIGIQGLYQSTLDVIKSLTALGLEQSAVRDISEANSSKDATRIGKTVANVRRLVWITGIFGLVIALIMSPMLSQWTFGTSDYSWGFVILSSTMLLNQLCAGQKVLLQGMRRLKELAKASAIGSTVGLLVSIPLYYWIGVKGIVPTMVLTSVTALLLSWFYSRRVAIERVEVTTKDAVREGTSMIKMGIAMSFSSILVAVSAYALRWFIRQQSGVNEVGLFSAGLLITNAYVGAVFSAMGKDYYPRLAAVNKNNELCKEIINQQGEILLLIIAPIIVSCIIFMPLIIRLIYSPEFLSANKYIIFAVSGMIFKAGSFVVAYIFPAKAESRLYIINETIANIYTLAIYLACYYQGGLQGLGIGFVIGYFLYFLQVYTISWRRYNFRFTGTFNRIFVIQLLFVISILSVVLTVKTFWLYVLAGLVLFLCAIFSLNELEKRLHVWSFLKRA